MSPVDPSMPSSMFLHSWVSFQAILGSIQANIQDHQWQAISSQTTLCYDHPQKDQKPHGSYHKTFVDISYLFQHYACC